MSNAAKWNKAVDNWAAFGQGMRKVGDGSASLRTCTAAAHAAEKHADVARIHAQDAAGHAASAANERKALQHVAQLAADDRLAALEALVRARRCWRWALAALVLALVLDLVIFLLTP